MLTLFSFIRYNFAELHMITKRKKKMKKIVLLSVVASSIIMAGGTIDPIEPVVEAPAEVASTSTSNWNFTGQGVLYYQTADNWGAGSLFEQGPKDANTGWAAAAAGIQLGAVNKDLFYGIGVGAEISGLSSLRLEKDIVSSLVQSGTGDLNGAEVTQAYITYGIGNTSLKIGRQQLPKALSPFAFSESWNVFKNTFHAALVVNSDIPDTTLVYAYVTRANKSVGTPLSEFTKINKNGDMVHMLTAQNKSISGLTLTGSWYLAPDMMGDGNDLNAVWGDAKFAIGDYSVAVQGGQISPDTADDTTAFGAKVAGNFGMFDASLAYSSVDDGTVDLANFGTGVKSPLYTQAILNQNAIRRDADSVKATIGAKALGGKFTLAYITSDLGKTANSSLFGTEKGEGTYQEIELIYKTKITKDITVFTAFINQNDDRQADDSQNFFRVWGRYTF